MVVLTDKASDDEFQVARNRLIDSGIRIITVGHTETGLNEDYYKQIASKPSNENVFVYGRKVWSHHEFVRQLRHSDSKFKKYMA